MEKIGAIWIRKSKKGREYLRISFQNKWYMAFKNRNKKKKKQPDCIIYQDIEEKTEKEEQKGGEDEDL